MRPRAGSVLPEPTPPWEEERSPVRGVRARAE